MNIDTNVPEPPYQRPAPERDTPARVSYGERLSQLESLEVGYSFGIYDMTQQQAFQCYYNPAKRLGIHITIRNMGDHVRLWRIK